MNFGSYRGFCTTEPNSKSQCHDGSHIYLIERPVVLTRSRRVTAALIAKYVNRASSLLTGAHAFHIRLSYVSFTVHLRSFRSRVSQSSSTSCSTSFKFRGVYRVCSGEL